MHIYRVFMTFVRVGGGGGGLKPRHWLKSHPVGVPVKKKIYIYHEMTREVHWMAIFLRLQHC